MGGSESSTDFPSFRNRTSEELWILRRRELSIRAWGFTSSSRTDVRESRFVQAQRIRAAPPKRERLVFGNDRLQRRPKVRPKSGAQPRARYVPLHCSFHLEAYHAVRSSPFRVGITEIPTSGTLANSVAMARHTSLYFLLPAPLPCLQSFRAVGQRSTTPRSPCIVTR